MKIIRRLSVRKLVTYEAADLDLTAAPITVIRGRNFDRKDKKSANAAGKSLLFSVLPTLFFAKPPTADRNKSAKDLFLDKNGSIEVDVSSNGNEYSLAQYVKGAGTLAYRVVENGTDLKYNKAIEALAKIRETFPLTEDQFYAFVYLDSRNYHVLQRGTSAARFEFFENIFNLGVYEVIAKSVGRRYTAVRDELRDLKTYQTEFASKRSELTVDRAAYDAMGQKIESLKSHLNVAQKKLSGWYEHLRQRDAFLVLTDSMSDDELRWPLDAMRSQVVRRKNQYQEMKSMYEGAVAQQRTEARRTQLVDQITRLKAQFDRLDFQTLAQPTMSHAEASATLAELRRQVVAQKKVWQESDWRALDQFGYDDAARAQIMQWSENDLVARRAAAQSQIQSARTTITKLRAVIDHARSHKTAVCPHCQQTLDVVSAETAITNIENSIADHERVRAKYDTALRYRQMMSELPTPSWNDYQKIQVNIERDRRRAQEALDAWTQIDQLKIKRTMIQEEGNRLRAELHAIPQPKEEYAKNPEVYRQFMDDIRAQVTALEAVILKKERLSEFPANWTRDQVERERTTLNSHIEGFQPRVSRIQAELQKTTVDYAQARALYTDLVRLNTKIKELRARTKDATVLEHMRDAFGPKGLRRNRIAVLAEMFTMNLNRFAPLVYGEKMVFQTVVGEREFDITATRNNGKTSDVRLLSGSEDKAFRLLSLLAILPFIPDSYRTNLVVLDEMESGLDPVSKQLFVNEFLPTLNSIIPNVVIITPQSEREFYVPNARTVVVEKRNGVSTLRKGNAPWLAPSSVSRPQTPSSSTSSRRRNPTGS